MHLPATVVSTINGTSAIHFEPDADGWNSLRFDAPPGLYRFSIIADARDFDWERLYTCTDGQRTGPWDFDASNGNTPLLPAYWVRCDDNSIGLWSFQLPVLEDLEARVLRGRFLFHLSGSGTHKLSLKSYCSATILWRSADLVAEPDDQLLALPPRLRPAREAAPPVHWRDKAFWEGHRQKLQTTHAIYKNALAASLCWPRDDDRKFFYQLPHLIAVYHLEKDDDALTSALAIIDQSIAKPHWNNPREDGFGHNGDMGAMARLKNLAFALHALGPRLGAERRGRLLEKLTLQGNRFFHNALLQADFWGGSLLQDHGWQSMFGFATACLYLFGEVPAAETWLSFALARVDRSINVMPRDGALPPATHMKLHNYLNEPTQLRDTLLAMGGPDLFDRGPFHQIVDFVCTVVRDDAPVMQIVGRSRDDAPLMGVNDFFNRIASKYNDGRAAWIQRRMLDAPAPDRDYLTVWRAFHHGNLWGFFTYDPAIEPTPPQRRSRSLVHFPDSGVVHFRDEDKDITVSLRLAPGNGHHSSSQCDCPCDMIDEALPGAGHFIVFHGRDELLTTPPWGYRAHSCLRSVMLINHRGQIGDVGYPMGVRMRNHPNISVSNVQWDAGDLSGIIRLDLTAAYPVSVGLRHYERQLHICSDGNIICCDEVVLTKPAMLVWLFQSRQPLGPRVEKDGRCRIGRDHSLTIEPSSPDALLLQTAALTDVVWSYASETGFAPYTRVRYETAQSVESIKVGFHLSF